MSRSCAALWAVAAVLVLTAPALRVVAALLRRSGHDVGGAVPTLFDLNTEQNVPTWYAVGLWLLLGLVAALLGVLDQSRRAGFWALSAVAALLSLDEAASLHEQYLGAVGERIEGAPHFAWVLPGLLVAVGLAAVLGRWVLALPACARRLVLAGGVAFVAGALGAETVSGQVLERYGDGAGYLAVTTLEEGLEMTGVLLALTGLLSLLQVDGDRGTLTLTLR